MSNLQSSMKFILCYLREFHFEVLPRAGETRKRTINFQVLLRQNSHICTNVFAFIVAHVSKLVNNDTLKSGRPIFETQGFSNAA
ncbi:hypothetical protein L596_005318 [Steinernema carpocapsae]|uniref:Uncharacterized protein n=1 Tax=Steinernema carpocapsae TaxID=34508 RepID=A0A4U8V073_STECR|nr:hypothetical protein L596_005318 [Steinernema carpocapsae]